MFVIPKLKPDEIIMYLRKSRTDDPALTVSETVARHEQMLDEYSMRTWGEQIPEQNRFREIVSGETIEARPEIKKVLRLIEQDRFKAILIVEPQRLSRGDLEDIGRLSKLLRFTNTFVITLQYSYDLNDERDRDYFERELKRGNEYLEYSKRIMENGRRISVESGAYIGSFAPFGYRKTHIRIGKKNIPTLEIIPEEADGIRMIYEMYADGKGADSIARALTLSGIKPKQNNEWKEAVIYRILDNPLYIGMIRFNYRRISSRVEDGEIVHHRNKNKTPDVYQGLHPAIVSNELWERVREQRTKRHVPAVHSNQVLSNPLAGLVYCECGRIMTKSSPSGGRKPRLYCTKQKDCGNVSAILDHIVIAVRDSLMESFSDLQIESAVETVPESKSNIEILQKRLSALEKKQDALWEQLAEGMPRDVFDRLIVQVVSDIESVKSAIDKEKQEEQTAKSAMNFRLSLMDALAALNNPAVSAGDKNKLLKHCIRRITYRKKAGEDFRLDIELML